jgi:hypothetical protein
MRVWPGLRFRSVITGLMLGVGLPCAGVASVTGSDAATVPTRSFTAAHGGGHAVALVPGIGRQDAAYGVSGVAAAPDADSDNATPTSIPAPAPSATPTATQVPAPGTPKIALTPSNKITSGSKLKFRVTTVSGANVVITVQVRGSGRLLYQLKFSGPASASGIFHAKHPIIYVPPQPVKAVVSVKVSTTRGHAATSTTITIVPKA